MTSAVCTLYEGNYHLGLAALVNSLYLNGFRGNIFVGYRGELPPWTKGRVSDANGYKVFQVGENCAICFVLLDTKNHFAYYKSHFMLQLLADHCKDNQALFYFDPDIVVRCRWTFFEEWIACGITVCEDLRSPVYVDGPQRTAWRALFEPKGYVFDPIQSIYVNSGFVGVRHDDAEFLKDWGRIIDLTRAAIGEANTILVGDPVDAFAIPDQDTFNIALTTTKRRVSFMNKQAMAFETGGFVMCHAIGRLKPWRENMLIDSFKGRLPMILEADKEFVKYANRPIQIYSPLHLIAKKIDRWLSTFVCKIRS